MDCLVELYRSFGAGKATSYMNSARAKTIAASI
jgi:hypothetical protein